MLKIVFSMHQFIKTLKLFQQYASFLQTRITKFSQDYVDPIVIDPLLDSINYILRDFKDKLLLDTFHINRFMLAFVSTPYGTVNTQCQLNNAIQGTESLDNFENKCKYPQHLQQDM